MGWELGSKWFADMVGLFWGMVLVFRGFLMCLIWIVVHLCVGRRRFKIQNYVILCNVSGKTFDLFLR